MKISYGRRVTGTFCVLAPRSKDGLQICIFKGNILTSLFVEESITYPSHRSAFKFHDSTTLKYISACTCPAISH